MVLVCCCGVVFGVVWCGVVWCVVVWCVDEGKGVVEVMVLVVWYGSSGVGVLVCWSV